MPRFKPDIFTPKLPDNISSTYGFSAQEIRRFKTAFDAFDMDKSGAIDTDETFVILRRLGMKPSYEDVVDLINQVDDNGNGTVEFDEFIFMMRRIERMKEEKQKSQWVDGLPPTGSAAPQFDSTKYELSRAERDKMRKGMSFNFVGRSAARKAELEKSHNPRDRRLKAKARAPPDPFKN
mmetsp:Transcript_16089/g.50302  ORF Transcript_16089/g.50302 Transcript_16089/m.50302 type:complete len:179 (-) Transcript_16089:1801-2337(-)